MPPVPANLPTRNANPGDLKNPATGTFRSFASPQDGFNALKQDLQGKITGNTRTGLNGNSTLLDFANVWSPTSDNRKPGLMTSEQYAANLAKRLGVSTATPIGQLGHRLDDFAKAIAQNEGFKGGIAHADEVPQQGQMTPDQFASKIKTKYPQYANIDNATLTQKILAKYPQYQKSIAAPIAQTAPHPDTSGATFPATPGEGAGSAALKTLGNIPSSLLNFGKGVISTLNPINIVKNLASIPGELHGLAKDTPGGLAAGLANTIDTANVGGALVHTLVPKAAQGLLQAGGGALTGNSKAVDEGLQTAQSSVTNDPVGSILPFLAGARGAADAADASIASRRAAAFPESGIQTMPQASRTLDRAASAVASPIQSAIPGALSKGSAFVKSPVSPIEAAGQIVQGKTAQAPVAADVLSKLDTSGVKTYADLSKALDTSVKGKLGQVDQIYKSQPGMTKLPALGRTVTSEVGGKVGTAKVNHVADALKQLKELYTKTNSPADTARIEAITGHAKETGLTPHDINLIAREYGTEFGSKAFDKKGDPLTSVNAQAFENTRKGVKETARSFLPDEKSRQLDKEIADSLHVKALTDRMAEAVNRLQQRVQQRGLVEKIARAAGHVTDIATLGAPKAFISKLFFPSNVGLKTLNSIDLQEQLAHNLQLAKRLNGLPDDTLVAKLIQLARNTGSAVNNAPSRLPRALNAMLLSRQPQSLQ
jgi:hypothetical protein